MEALGHVHGQVDKGAENKERRRVSSTTSTEKSWPHMCWVDGAEKAVLFARRRAFCTETRTTFVGGRYLELLRDAAREPLSSFPSIACVCFKIFLKDTRCHFLSTPVFARTDDLLLQMIGAP